ncbi:hypothetical protein J4232_02495 [Candidatus Woesearchaeota archaeon]|nr:hypothetical protein [Candidatus Woesearchaeota archaeon]
MLETMVKNIVIVATEQDLCSRNIGHKLQEHFTPFKHESCPYPTLKKDNAILVWHPNDLVLDISDLNKYFDPEIYIFPFRHLGKGLPRLTVHPAGNFRLPQPDSKVPYRGEPHKLAYVHPGYMKLALQHLDKLNKERELGYNVSYEVTHHTPTELKAPVMFLEIGDTEQHHNDEKAVQAITDTVLYLINAEPKQSKNCLALGGDHYAERFTRRGLEEEFAFGHFIPYFTFPDVTPEVIELALDKTIGGVQCAMLDRKAQGSEADRQKILAVLEKRGIELIKLSK